MDYLEYNEYRRIDQDKFSQVPSSGCDGIEWGVAYLDESPHLQMSNSVAIGKSNLGPCYSPDFRIPGTTGLVAIGTYGNRVIHALNCQMSN